MHDSTAHDAWILLLYAAPLALLWTLFVVWMRRDKVGGTRPPHGPDDSVG